MKNKLRLAYVVGFGQVFALLLTGYMIFHYYTSHGTLLKSVRSHLTIQVIIGLFLLYSIYHYLKIKKISSKMRKAAQTAREAKSKRVEILIFSLLLALLFFSLFYTVPGRRYTPSTWELSIYLVNSLLEFFMLTSLFSSSTEGNPTWTKSKQRYGILGALSGLLLFYVYYQW
ncbi:MAG: hypothetical protein AAFN93_01830 [Bacteroidota bacterium]